MRKIAAVLTIALVIAACGDDDSVGATLPPVDDTPAATSASTVPVATTTAATPPTSAPAANTPVTGPTDCLEIWPEAAVQAIAGNEYTFFAANDDLSACTYFSMPNGIALAWRTGDRAGFELGKAGAGAVSGTSDSAVCDAGYAIELPGAGILMEAHSDAQGRTFTATMSGMGVDLGREWSAALLEGVC